MKAFKITNYTNIDLLKDDFRMDGYARAIGTDDMQVSDGFHTMDELYDHRITLFVKLCGVLAMVEDTFRQMNPNTPQSSIWRSKRHSDGSALYGWFIMGIGKAKGSQITYHLPLSRWDETEFAETLEIAPEFDGHTSADVLNRLKKL